MVIVKLLNKFNALNGSGEWSFQIEDRVFSGKEYDTSFNRLEILSVIKCLEFLVETKEVLIIGQSRYLISGGQNFLKTWEKNNWTTKQGYPLKNQDLWAELADLCRAHNKVSFVFGEKSS